MEHPQPVGYRWRSSRFFILCTVSTALFAETFLYGYLVPILAHMLEVRLRIDPSQTQQYITTLLSIHGFLTVVAAPVIAHFVDKTPSRKGPLLIALTACLIGTILVAWTPTRTWVASPDGRLTNSPSQFGLYSLVGTSRRWLARRRGSSHLPFCWIVRPPTTWGKRPASP